ncbi:hypothetical protein NV64_14140 [Erwinia sp. B116]|nr:hypothetical protein NV64_14140 [Erwinia sp. B116]
MNNIEFYTTTNDISDPPCDIVRSICKVVFFILSHRGHQLLLSAKQQFIAILGFRWISIYLRKKSDDLYSTEPMP